MAVVGVQHVCVAEDESPAVIALRLHESDAAVKLRAHGADLNTAAAIVGTLANDDIAALVAALQTSRQSTVPERGWVPSTTAARILAQYPATARAKRRDDKVVHTTYKGVRYWHRKLVASLWDQEDAVDTMPFDDDDVVDPDDPRRDGAPPRAHFADLEWLSAQNLIHMIVVHPVFGTV
tara:strand:- start:242 stop:778 length:537 start_codon:yes stop_codon:yes gene_type:complete